MTAIHGANSEKKSRVSCPICQKYVFWNAQQKSKPFCSERCKLIDLGEWAAEERRIPCESISSEPDNDYYLQ